MSKFFRRLFCVSHAETLENENDDNLAPNIAALDKLLELEAALNSKFESLESKLDEKLERNLQSTSNVVEKVPLSIELINNKLNLLHKQLQEVEEKVNKTLEFAEKQSILEEKKIQVIGDSNKVPVDKYKTNTASADPLEQATICTTWKEHRFFSKTYKNLYPLDHPSLQNVEVKREGDKLTYLSMNIAVRASNYAAILLSPVQNPGDDDYVFEIVLGEKDVKLSHTTKQTRGKYVVERNCDNVLHPRNYALFYIQIANGSLHFWSDSPRYTGHYRNYLEVEDANLAAIKYFGFNMFMTNECMFLFDCKPSFEGAVFPVRS